MYISKRKRVQTVLPVSAEVPKKEEARAMPDKSPEPEDLFADYIPTESGAELISTAEPDGSAPPKAESVPTTEKTTEDSAGESTTYPPPFSAPTESSLDITFDEFLKRNGETGTLRVQAFIGDRGMPVEAATVIVFANFSDGERIFYTVKTNADGIADGLILPAPSRESSELPGSTNPYAEYSVTVSHPDYLSQRYEKVPIFAGIRSIQPVAFLPSLNGG